MIRQVLACLLILSVAFGQVPALAADRPAGATQSRTRTADDPALTRQFVSQLPIGSVVKIDLVSGERLTATLMAVATTDMVVKPKTRVPEPARTVPFDQIARIEPKGNSNVTKSVVIGVAAGAAAFFGIWLFAVSVSD